MTRCARTFSSTAIGPIPGGAPYVRVFGGGTWGQGLADADFAQAAETVRWWRKERAARGWRTDMLLETHDAFSAAAPCAELMRRLDVPVGVIWDSHHTWRLGGESPSESWSCLSAWVRHVHLKDSVDKPSARHPFTYVLPGRRPGAAGRDRQRVARTALHGLGFAGMGEALASLFAAAANGPGAAPGATVVCGTVPRPPRNLREPLTRHGRACLHD